MRISGAELRQRLREARWAWWFPAAFFVGIGFLPSGWIEASPGEVFRPPVLFAPMAWPLFVMGLVFGAAAFSVRLRRHGWHILFLGTAAALLFNLLVVVLSGWAALYSWELGTDLQNRIFVNFELDFLAFRVQPMVIALLVLSGLVLWVRGGRPGPEEPAPGVAPPIEVAPPVPAAPPVEAEPEPPLVPGAEPEKAGPPPGEPPAPASPLDAGGAGRGAPAPSGPASPLDTITGAAPEAAPEGAAGTPAVPEPAPPAAAPVSPPEKAPPDGGFTP